VSLAALTLPVTSVSLGDRWDSYWPGLSLPIHIAHSIHSDVEENAILEGRKERHLASLFLIPPEPAKLLALDV
jgi:hypothetical protein